MKEKEKLPVVNGGGENGVGDEPPVEETPKQKCERLNSGKAGYCDDEGNFHAAG